MVVQELGRHLTGRDGAGALEEAIGERRLPWSMCAMMRSCGSGVYPESENLWHGQRRNRTARSGPHGFRDSREPPLQLPVQSCVVRRPA